MSPSMGQSQKQEQLERRAPSVKRKVLVPTVVADKQAVGSVAHSPSAEPTFAGRHTMGERQRKWQEAGYSTCSDTDTSQPGRHSVARALHVVPAEQRQLTPSLIELSHAMTIHERREGELKAMMAKKLEQQQRKKRPKASKQREKSNKSRNKDRHKEPKVKALKNELRNSGGSTSIVLSVEEGSSGSGSSRKLNRSPSHVAEFLRRSPCPPISHKNKQTLPKVEHAIAKQKFPRSDASLP